jgi:hypothetical protein
VDKRATPCMHQKKDHIFALYDTHPLRRQPRVSPGIQRALKTGRMRKRHACLAADRGQRRRAGGWRRHEVKAKAGAHRRARRCGGLQKE